MSADALQSIYINEQSPGEVPVQRTGSYPPWQNGWHRASRLNPNHTPRATPYFATASIMYSEQVGSNRQADGNSGEIQRL